MRQGYGSLGLRFLDRLMGYLCDLTLRQGLVKCIMSSERLSATEKAYVKEKKSIAVTEKTSEGGTESYFRVKSERYVKCRALHVVNQTRQNTSRYTSRPVILS